MQNFFFFKFLFISETQQGEGQGVSVWKRRKYEKANAFAVDWIYF